MKILSLIDFFKLNNTHDKGISFINSENDIRYLSYADLYAKSTKLLKVLIEKGIKPSNELIFQIDENEQFVKLFWASILGGIVPVPVTPGNNDEQVFKVMRIWENLNDPYMAISQAHYNKLEKTHAAFVTQIKNKIVIIDDLIDYSESVELDYSIINKNVKSTDLAFIQYSSGSTGDPKGVMITHQNVIVNLSAFANRILSTSEDSSLCWMPLTHDMGLIAFHCLSFFNGMNQYIMPTNLFVRRPLLWLQMASKYDVSLLYSPNFGYKYYLQYFEAKGTSSLDLSNVRLIFNGAEPISVSLCNKFMSELAPFGLKDTSMYPSYGMAEATIAIAFPELHSKFSYLSVDRRFTNIGDTLVAISNNDENSIEFVFEGTTIENCHLKICDVNGKDLGENRVGIIHISGGNVTSGYYNNAEATEKIIKEGWLNTGDLGFIYEGQLAVTGRVKDIIFVNGQNYYPHDIERIAENIDGVEHGKVVACGAFDTQNQKEVISVFVQYRGSIDEFIPLCRQIKQYIQYKLAITVDYVVPIKKIPKTTSGKFQRFILSKEIEENIYQKTIEEINNKIEIQTQLNYVAPRNEVEDKLVSIWSKTLNHMQIGVGDDFFELGGDSISLTQMITLVNDEFSSNITHKTLLEANTIEKLSVVVDQSVGSKIIKYSDYLVKGDLENSFPLTHIQFAYLTGRSNIFELGGVATHGYYEFATPLDIKLFNQSLNSLIQYQPMLRAIIYDTYEQVILPEVPEYLIVTTDVSNLPWHLQEKEIEIERNRMSHHVFKTDCWPLFEIKAFKISETLNYLFFGFDLLVVDGGSMRMFFDQLMQFYKNPSLKLGKPEFTYQDYVLSYESFKKADKYNQDKSFWLNKLSDFPMSPSLPLKTDPSKVGTPKFCRLQETISAEIWGNVKQNGQLHSLTPSAILCNAFSKILSIYSNQQRFALNLTLFNRLPFHESVNDIIGDFTSTILLDISLDKENDFYQNAKKLQYQLFESLEHSHYDGIEFIRELVNYNNLGKKAAMPVVFTSMLFSGKELGASLEEIGEIKCGISQTPQVYLDFQVMECSGSLIITWDYVEQIFDKSTIGNMFNHLISLINEVSIYNNNPQIVLHPSEVDLYNNYNNTKEDIEQSTLHELFTRQVLKSPNNIAVQYYDEKITYSDLDKKSNQIARYLIEIGVSRGTYVGVLGERTINTIANILAILKAGAAYVPIDPQYPIPRRDYILENSNCITLLTNQSYAYINASTYSDAEIRNSNVVSDVAYVIYTSGSTGNPKGVVIEHGPASNTIIDINQKFNVTESDRIIGLSSLGFDLSVYDVFGSLSTGATLVLIKDIKDVKDLSDLIVKEEITLWNSVPAIMDMMLDSIESGVSGELWKDNGLRLKTVMLSGDWIPLHLPTKIAHYFKNANVISLGGATEASIWSIYYPISKIEDNWKSIPYGIPLANQSFYVLNYDLKRCPIGVAGDLYIGGVGLAKEYLKDAQKTDAAFIYHPVHGRIYKTGDQGVMHHQGYIEFLGRLDHQIKIRGHRIELGEIEKSLQNISEIKNAVVIDFTDEKTRKKQLCAYYLSDTELQVADLKKMLSATLPDYMIPSFIMRIDAIPLTSNGKVNRKALPEPKNISVNVSVENGFPASNTEKVVSQIMKEILKIEEVNVNDNLFDFGASSVDAIQASIVLGKRMNLDIPTLILFEHSNIKSLANHIDTNYLNKDSLLDKEDDPQEIRSHNRLRDRKSKMDNILNDN